LKEAEVAHIEEWDAAWYWRLQVHGLYNVHIPPSVDEGTVEGHHMVHTP